MATSTYNRRWAVVRSSSCAFHSQPRIGDAGIFSLHKWKRQRGWRHEAGRTLRCMAVAISADWVFSQETPDRAESAVAAADRGYNSAQAGACAGESQSA